MAEKKPPRPPAAKAPRGRPPKMVVKIDDTPENVAKALFGKRRKQTEKKDSENRDG